MDSFFGIAIFGAAMGAWVTHVVYCISHYMWGLLIAGGLIFPVGIIHGIMIWLGYGMG
jgi:hypothetical protein